MKTLNALPKVVGLIIWTSFLFSIEQAFAQNRWSGAWHMGPGMMGGWGMGWFGGIFMFIFWILVIVGLIFLLRWMIQNTKRNSSNNTANSNKALDILNERYARGEINKEEFERIKKDILS